MVATVCPFEARAWLKNEPVAASSKALQVNQGDGVPMLCFPVSDVKAQPAAGNDALLRGAPEGYVAFDPEHPDVRVALVDDCGSTDERDRTLKRYPTWGDTSQLLDLLNVQREAEGTYVGLVRDNTANGHRLVVEGSQMLAQSIVAAGRHAPGRRTVSATMVFMRTANTSEPLRIELEEFSAGRNFSTLAPHVRQGGKLCASGIMLLDATASDVIRHHAPAPETPGPYASEPYDMWVTGRDVRFVDAAYSNDPSAPVGPPVIDAWVRYRDVPDDPYLHAGLLAQFTGQVSIAAAMRPHPGVGQGQAHRTLSTAINAISISLHANVRADRWMRYHHRSTFAGDGMTHSECRVYGVEGDLLASFTVDAMVRRFSSERPVNERTSL